MRKLFGANKKKKSSTNLKAGTLKIPIPMINGSEYADLTESQMSTLIGGGNRDYHKKKLTSSLSSQRTNNTTQTEKTPSNIPVQQQPVTPSRSISSPPILVMPKPMHSLPPTRYLLRNYDYEKTQVESSSSSSSGESSQEEEEEQGKEHRIMSSPLPLKTEREDDEGRNHQSYTFVTRTSEDSIKQYVSASESPFPTASSIVSSMNQPNVATLSPSFSSPSSPVKNTSIGNDMIHANEPKRATSSVPLPASSTFANTPAAADDDDSNVHHKQDTPKPLFSNSNDAVIQEFPLPPSNLYAVAEDTHSRNLPSVHEYNNTKSTTPPTKKRVSRPPTSSSGSSATVGHDVTHSQNRLVNNNSDKPPGSLLQTISSESPAFHQNNSNSRMDSLTEMLQSEIKKMALNADLLELKRTVDRMQQQRVTDLEDHLTRVAEQKLREMEILEQIKQTKQRLDMAIAENMFTNKNSGEQEVPKQPTDDQAPVMKSSSSTNTTRSNKLRSSGSMNAGTTASNSHIRHQHPQQPPANRQRHRRSLPSAYQRLPAQNEYFPDMNNPNFEFDYPPPPQFGYPQDYDPEINMMMMMNGNQSQFVDPFTMDSPRGRYTHRKSSLQRRPRSKSMESQWQDQLDLDQHYMLQQQQQHPLPSYPNMHPDGNFYYATPRTRSRKSSLRSAKSSSSDSDDNNNSNKNDDFDQAQANSANREESVMDKPESARQHEMGSDEDRHHPTRHRSGSGRFRQGHPHPGAMGNMPPNMFAYPNGLPPLPHLMDRERMKMRPPPPPPPHYGYNNMPPPPPPGNEYFSYMPPSQRISPRMMAALAADEQNQQQQQQQQQPYGGYQWGAPPPPPPQGMYGIPPPPPPDNLGAAANLPCDQQTDQQAFGNRRFPPPPPSVSGGQQQPNTLQQTPQPPPPQGYISMYGERMYM
ncbi:Translation initiation factor 3 subunit c [Mucor velutinosus]|uniref:Translation initiation factor 3 subunit c n=1 Tax=Mucor velutinosus TaxID=708070 RepID=A0AAN7DN12_9FUNG|nr:Translation initiation factor 3 subunit c [Mucor velutinosus]